MAETVNIAEASAKISRDIFNVFKWKVSENYDVNLDCEIEEHCKPSHPCDCVFYYIDPYTSKFVFLNTDLKSFAVNSITKGSIEAALKSLSLAIHCANFSESWNDKYLIPLDMRDYDIRGFLFVYNHDDMYDKNFSDLLSKIQLPNLVKKQKIHVFSPQVINKLHSIALDFKAVKSDLDIEKYTFWYPDMILHKVSHGEEWEQPATIEMLCSPLIIIKYKDRKGEEGFIIYYNREGDTVEEFVYLIDLLSHYQILKMTKKIELRVVSENRSDNILNNMRNAKISYLQTWGLDEIREDQLNLISTFEVTRSVERFNLSSFGWRE